ncbi:GyrI-like domain-containing protein [Chryseobacterium taeanense]|uniref:AraC family transcriptional regulator n=1 Tax=Chryseobacterium taeanense TaxID=311334 RepID=UPI0035AE6BAD
MKRSNDIYINRINRAIDYVNANVDKNISLEELAAVTFFSAFHFHRIFVAITGETVKNFTNHIRMEKAARLLRFSGKRISDIALECGFSDTSSFSRLFRQYFETSPTEYKNGIEIKSSKIRKALYPVNTYHCNINEEELENRFLVEIRAFAQRSIAYIRLTDAFREGVVLNAFKKIVDWAKEKNLFDTETIFGMSLDDPEVTPKEKYRYEVCITLPDHFNIKDIGHMQVTVLPECRYAVTKISGDLAEVGKGINYMFDVWLTGSNYECRHLHAMEIFMDKENICNWDHFDLEFCIPVKALKNIT